MKHRNKIGDIFAISLPNGEYAYGRLFLEGSVGFYKYRSNNINDLPKNEDYEFIICVHKSCFKNWLFIENRPFEKEQDARPPLYQMKDIGTENYKVYDYGTIRPSTKEECKNLEVCSVWEEEHIIKRLTDDEENWKKWFPRFY